MEEAIADIALDHKPPPSEGSIQSGVQGDMLTDNQDQAQLPPNAPKGSEASRLWFQKRTVRVEALHLGIASGTYQVDTAELARCILHNTTHFLETR